MTITVRQWDDPTSWNEFVASVPFAHFHQSWEWGELAPDLGGKAIRLAAVRQGVMAAAIQVFINPLSHTRKSHLYVPRGPAIGEPSVELMAPLLDAARLVGMEADAIGVKIEPNIPGSDACWQSTLCTLGLRQTFPPSQPRSSWVLDIDRDEDTLLAGMKQKTRYNIRLAGRKGVSVEETGVAELDAFYDLYRATADRDGFFIHDKQFYARMFDTFQRTGSFCLLLAKHDGVPLSAVTLLRFGSTCWYVHGASSNEHRNLMAPYLLQWQAIRWAQRSGCTLYDFRAIPDVLQKDQDMYGVYRFKEGFGGRQFTTMHTYAAAYDPALFGLWQAYFSSRFALTARLRRRRGLPARQFA